MKTLKIEFRKMDNEKYNQIIDEAYENYQWKQLKLFPAEPDSNLPKEEFINKCKTDAKFSERWGLLIKETYNLIPHTEDFGDGLTITRPKRRNKLIVVYKNEIIEVYE